MLQQSATGTMSAQNSSYVHHHGYLTTQEGEAEAERLLATNDSPIFLRMLQLVGVHRSSKAYMTYKKIKAQLLNEFAPEVFEDQKQAIQTYLKFMNDKAIRNPSLSSVASSTGTLTSSSQASLLQRQDSGSTMTTASSYRSVQASDIPSRQVSMRQFGSGHERSSSHDSADLANGNQATATIGQFESIDDFIDYLARVTKVPLERALEIISMDLRLNHESIFRPRDAMRAAEALLAHRLNEQIDILISCGVAGDEHQAKEVLEPIAQTHADQVMSELRLTFSQGVPAGAPVGGLGTIPAPVGGLGTIPGSPAMPTATNGSGSLRSLQSGSSGGSSSSRSLLSSSPGDSPGGSYRRSQGGNGGLNYDGSGGEQNPFGSSAPRDGDSGASDNSSNGSTGSLKSSIHTPASGTQSVMGSTSSNSPSNTYAGHTDWDSQGGLGSPAANHYRHSSPAINSLSASGGAGVPATRDLSAQRSALAAMQVARLRASSRSQSASMGRLNPVNETQSNDMAAGDASSHPGQRE